MEINSNNKREERDTVKFPTKVGPDKHAPWRNKDSLETTHETAGSPKVDQDNRPTVRFQYVYQ